MNAAATRTPAAAPDQPERVAESEDQDREDRKSRKRARHDGVLPPVRDHGLLQDSVGRDQDLGPDQHLQQQCGGGELRAVQDPHDDVGEDADAERRARKGSRTRT